MTTDNGQQTTVFFNFLNISFEKNILLLLYKNKDKVSCQLTVVR